jgi:hypothetical protein
MPLDADTDGVVVWCTTRLGHELRPGHTIIVGSACYLITDMTMRMEMGRDMFVDMELRQTCGLVGLARWDPPEVHISMRMRDSQFVPAPELFASHHYIHHGRHPSYER